jgi:hypothetical protein
MPVVDRINPSTGISEQINKTVLVNTIHNPGAGTLLKRNELFRAPLGLTPLLLIMVQTTPTEPSMNQTLSPDMTYTPAIEKLFEKNELFRARLGHSILLLLTVQMIPKEPPMTNTMHEYRTLRHRTFSSRQASMRRL